MNFGPLTFDHLAAFLSSFNFLDEDSSVFTKIIRHSRKIQQIFLLYISGFMLLSGVQTRARV